jgi:hypothetical protein
MNEFSSSNIQWFKGPDKTERSRIRTRAQTNSTA